MGLDFGTFSKERFFSEFWRKKPLHLKGVAPQFSGVSVDRERFLRICDRLDPSHVSRLEDGTIFAQNMDTASFELATASESFASELSCASVWFDGVLAGNDSGIGSHYDHSDNFVLQQSGTKIWRLASPASVPDEELRGRMREVGGTGLIWMPDDALEFVVEPGDVLYMPLFWAHWGVSVGESMSVSIVYNARNPLDALQSTLTDALSEHRHWWYPMHLLPAGDGLDDIERQARHLSQNLVRDLVGTLTDPSFASDLETRFSEHLHAPLVLPDEDEPDAYGIGDKGEPKPLLTSVDLVGLAETPIYEGALEDLLTIDATPELIHDARARVAQSGLRYLKVASDFADHWIEDKRLRADCRAVMQALDHLEPGQLLFVLMDPAFLLWSHRAREAIQSHYAPRVAAVFEYLATAAFVHLVRTETLADDVPLRLVAGKGVLRLSSLGFEYANDGVGSEVTVTASHSELLFRSGDHTWQISTDDLLDRQGPDGWRPMAHAGPIVCAGEDPLFHHLYPYAGRGGVAPLSSAQQSLDLSDVSSVLSDIASYVVVRSASAPGWQSATSYPAPGVLTLPSAPTQRDAASARVDAIAQLTLHAHDILIPDTPHRLSCPFAEQLRPVAEVFCRTFRAVELEVLERQQNATFTDQRIDAALTDLGALDVWGAEGQAALSILSRRHRAE